MHYLQDKNEIRDLDGKKQEYIDYVTQNIPMTLIIQFSSLLNLVKLENIQNMSPGTDQVIFPAAMQ